MNKILLIENEDVGRHYTELIQKVLENIEIIWVRNYTDALNVVKTKEIKVVIYDQRLDNNELGTEIMLKLVQVDPCLIGIMLSAYATPTDTARAAKSGIMYEFVSKQK